MKKIIACLPVFLASSLGAVVQPYIDPKFTAQKIHTAVQQGKIVEQALSEKLYIKTLPPKLRQQICVEYFFVAPRQSYEKLLRTLNLRHKMSIQDYLDHGFDPDGWLWHEGKTLSLSQRRLTSLIGMQELIKRLGDRAQNIKKVYLRNNHIATIAPGTFRGLSNVQELYLAGNPIPEQERETIRKMVREIAPHAVIYF